MLISSCSFDSPKNPTRKWWNGRCLAGLIWWSHYGNPYTWLGGPNLGFDFLSFTNQDWSQYRWYTSSRASITNSHCIQLLALSRLMSHTRCWRHIHFLISSFCFIQIQKYFKIPPSGITVIFARIEWFMGYSNTSWNLISRYFLDAAGQLRSATRHL